MASGPLDGTRVLEFTQIIAGPLGCQLLSDLGGMAYPFLAAATESTSETRICFTPPAGVFVHAPCPVAAHPRRPRAVATSSMLMSSMRVPVRSETIFLVTKTGPCAGSSFSWATMSSAMMLAL